MKWTTLALVLSMACHAQDKTALVTVFREDHGFVDGYKAYADADKGKIPSMWLTLDGKDLAKMSNGRFVTVSLPSGDHLFKIRKIHNNGGELRVTLEPGQHLFLRPATVYTHAHFQVVYKVEIIPCEDALALGRATDPMRGKDIGVFPPINENVFTRECK